MPASGLGFPPLHSRGQRGSTCWTAVFLPCPLNTKSSQVGPLSHLIFPMPGENTGKTQFAGAGVDDHLRGGHGWARLSWQPEQLPLPRRVSRREPFLLPSYICWSRATPDAFVPESILNQGGLGAVGLDRGFAVVHQICPVCVGSSAVFGQSAVPRREGVV